MDYLKIYDKNHNILDEIDIFNNDLTYGWTLNDIDTASFSIGLENNKCNEINLQFRNLIEICDGDTGIVKWGGQISGLNFNDQAVKVNCIDNLSLLKWRRMRAKTYTNLTYGSLFTQMINDANAITPSTIVTIGNIDNTAIATTRTVTNTEDLITNIQSFAADLNYDFNVDVDRKFNFYTRKGSDKPYYSLTYGGDADNIIKVPTLAQDIMSMANSIYSEISSPVLNATAQDDTSIGMYGLMEGTYSSSNSINS
ncbi:hypothetical protein [Clostridium pasteurianum]|uniref:Phage minor structural protein n=1 Tax=Clostridium pasteurianum BC1 TaxID=86416 RepID=R4KAZ8_CLOPA|nr:hypothetical protein [Clostridium pasteurianum]AGK96810.1 hypothetical protein Clopa_1910 [Clostridium pasteurianum BC1]